MRTAHLKCDKCNEPQYDELSKLNDHLEKKHRKRKFKNPKNKGHPNKDKFETVPSEPVIDSDHTSGYVQIEELIQKNIWPGESSCTEDEHKRVEIEQPEPMKMKPELTLEYFETHDLMQDEVKPESSGAQVTLDDSHSLVAGTSTTYLCSFDACTFMTTVFNDNILSEHYSSRHPDVSTGEQKEFIKLP